MSRLPEAVGTPAPSPLVDQHGRPAQFQPAPWKKADGTDIKPLIIVPKGQQNREYHPEVQEFEGHDVSTDEYVKRFRGRVQFPASSETGLKEAMSPGLDAAVQVPVAFREGGRLRYRWKPARIGSMEAYRAFLGSPGGVGKRHLEESGGFDSDHAGGGNFYTPTPGSPTQLIDGNDFVPFLNGPFYKQLYQYDYLKMHARAFELVNHHALAAGACKIMTRFVVGRGISFSIKDERARDLWDDFWERNDMRAKVRQMARDLMWQGELMLRYYEREPGKLTMRILDPSTCWEVVTDPEDFEHCLDGSTRIALLDGTEPTVEELAARGISETAPAWTYSWDKAARKIAPGKITKCWQQPNPKRCIEVELDSGEKVVMSYDHPVLMRDGEYCWAERLQPGDSLMPLEALNNHKVVAVRDVGARVVYDMQVERHHNFALAAGIFTHNTYYYHFQWPCLRGDVRIACLDGTNPTIAELAERHERDGQSVWVYSYDEATKRIVPGEASKIWRTGTKRCVEVELDSGEKVVCSYDHPFLKRDGQYVEAEKLQPGASLMPLYRRQGYEEAAKAPNNHKVVAVRQAGEHVVYDMQVERHHNFALASGVFTHNTPYQIWTNGNIPVSKYIIQEVPPSFVQHVKINVSAQEKRGRSDLLAAMPHMKRFDDFYNGAVMKAVLEANLVYKIKVHGDFADLDQMSQDTQFTILPPPGGTWLENDAVDMTPMSAVMTAGRGSQGIGQQIASIVATSLNLPTEYFNIEGGASSRATALVRTDPAVKAVEDRQQILTETLENTYDRVMEAGLREGLIRPQDARRDPEVVGDEGMADQERGGEDLPFAPQAHSALPARAFAPRQQRPQARASFPGRPVRAVAVRG